MSDYFVIRAECGHGFLSEHRGATAARCLHCEQKENQRLRNKIGEAVALFGKWDLRREEVLSVLQDALKGVAE